MQLTNKALLFSFLLSTGVLADGHHKHAGEQDPASISLDKRETTCDLPDDSDIVKITPNKDNKGWAMSPDQSCKSGSYCPYACKPGKLMAQWDTSAKTYSYPKSQNGGLKCGSDGKTSKPFDNKPLCVDGAGTVKVNNKADKNVAFCQTVLPGNEAMLIPTDIDSGSTETIAVPDSDYWAGTAAHYYINPPGVSTEDGCAWGTKDKAQGNWAPYVAGANQDDNGETFVKIGWNPVYLEKDTSFHDKKPSFGIRIKCDGDCSGDPCEIDPRKQDVNEVKGKSDSGSSDVSKGAGDGKFCVVTAKKGTKATIEVFDASSSDNKKRDNTEGNTVSVSHIFGTTTRTVLNKAAQTGSMNSTSGNATFATNGTTNSTSNTTAASGSASELSGATTTGASVSLAIIAAAAYFL